MLLTNREHHRLNRRLLGPWAVALLAVVGCQAPEPAPQVLAVYEGGTVTHPEYVSWLFYKGAEDDPKRKQQNFLSIAITETLAASARDRGLLEEPAIKARLFVREAQILEKELQLHVGDGQPWESLRAELMAGIQYDLKRAQLVSTLDSQRVIDFPDGRGLELGEVRAWLKLRNARADPADLLSEQYQGLAKELALQARILNRARELGLAEKPEVVAVLVWGEQEILLLEETKFRIQKSYRPASEAEVRARFEAEASRLGTMTFEEARSQVEDLLRQETVKGLQGDLQNELEAQLALRLADGEKK